MSSVAAAAAAAASLMSHPGSKNISGMPLPLQIICWTSLAIAVIGIIHTEWVTRKWR